MYPEPDFEYEEKRGRIAMELEMFILDAILTVLERMNLHNQQVNENKKGACDDTQQF